MDIKALIKENPIVIVSALTVVTLLGGSMAIELPADKKVKALEVKIAQTWQQREKWQEQQQRYHTNREVEELQFRLRYISNEINRINQIPQYLNRPMTQEESWTVEQLKEEWVLLQERLQQVSQE